LTLLENPRRSPYTLGMAKVKTKAPKKTGRPTKYNKGWPLAAEYMSRKGMVDKEMAAKIGVAESTFHLWKQKHPEFAEALNKGKNEIDDKVESALFQRALGYDYEESVENLVNGKMMVTTIYHKHMPGNTTACIYTLNNRRPEIWRQKQQIEHVVDGQLAQINDGLAEYFARNPEPITDE